MSTAYEGTGRTKQKARTRSALLAAARDALTAGETPTVEEAASAAGVARATAYRYFPNQSSLLLATLPEMSEPSLLGESPPADVEERLDLTVKAIAAQTVAQEAVLRNMLRLSLEPDAGARDDRPFRTGRRLLWIGEALAPLQGRLAEQDLERLVRAIAATVGIDALVWLTDIARLSRDDAAELMRWSARALLRAAIAEAGENGEGGIRTRDGR